MSQSIIVRIPDAINTGIFHEHLFKARKLWSVRWATFEPGGGGLYANGHLIWDSCSNSALRRGRLLRFPTLPAKKLPGMFVAFGGRKNNYYHWLIEDMPRILEARREFPDLQAVSHSRLPEFARETLADLKIPLILTARAALLETAIVSSRGSDSGWPHPEDIEILRGNFRAVSASQTRVVFIYVSRRFSRRPIRREVQIESLMRTLGAEVVYLERLKVADQVNLFTQAELVVGAHGAGLTNAVFMREGASLIEIAAVDRAIDCFEIIASHVGFRYRRLLTDQEWNLAQPSGEPLQKKLEQMVQEVLRDSGLADS